MPAIRSSATVSANRSPATCRSVLSITVPIRSKRVVHLHLPPVAAPPDQPHDEAADVTEHDKDIRIPFAGRSGSSDNPHRDGARADRAVTLEPGALVPIMVDYGCRDERWPLKRGARRWALPSPIRRRRATGRRARGDCAEVSEPRSRRCYAPRRQIPAVEQRRFTARSEVRHDPVTPCEEHVQVGILDVAPDLTLE